LTPVGRALKPASYLDLVMRAVRQNKVGITDGITEAVAVEPL
jgi:hypothetical protein